MSKYEFVRVRFEDWWWEHGATVRAVGLLLGGMALSVICALVVIGYVPGQGQATPTATPDYATHIPTRTLTPIDPTVVSLPVTATWTRTYTPSRTVTAVPRTATRTFTASVTPTTRPSATVGLITTPGRKLTAILPNSGASQQDIAGMTATITPPPSLTLTPTAQPTYNLPAFECGIGGSIESLEWRDNVYTVTLRCPNLKWKGQGIGD